MKRYSVIGILMIAAILGRANAQAQPGFVNTLMPQPAKLEVRTGALLWTEGFTVSTAHFTDARLSGAIQRLLLQLQQMTGTRITNEVGTAPGAALVIDVQGPGKLIQSTDENEAYSLSVNPSGARIQAATVVGAMLGMQTFLQLLQTAPGGYSFPAVQIDDAPRFPWRGLMVDCGRHFEPVEVIKRTLDGMAAVKLNVFHWHLSEDQGFRMESLLYPKLTCKGSDGLFYTQAQAREVVAYARERGIRVVPEFDMPGHSRSWFVGYPELASGPGPYSIRREFGIDPAAMDPSRESTFTFLDGFVGEMAGIFPDPYMHVGGDESDGSQWKANASIQAFMKAHSLANSEALQGYFNGRMLTIFQKHQKRMVGWDEVLTPTLPKAVVIQSWRGAESLTLAAQQGNQGVLSQPYYLDAMKSAEEHYLADPLPSNSILTVEQRKLILGGEICMWAEHLNERSIDSRIWPRSAAMAERFWSAGEVKDPDDMYRRLAAESIRLEALGLTHLSHQDGALRQLAGSEDVDALRVLASVLQPVGFSERYTQQHTDQLTALDNLVDAIRPDPPSRSDIQRWTRTFLTAPATSQPARTSLEQAFQRLAAAAPSIDAQMATTPLLAKAAPLAQQLGPLASAGLEALNYISKNQKAPVGWRERQLKVIAVANQPETLVRFTFLTPLTELVNAVQQ